LQNEPKDVTHNFRELFEASQDCKFGNCTHRNEPKCAVKDAIEILDEVEDQNYWERHRDM